MNMAEFKNRPNELLTKETIGERKIYHSRSVALVTTVLVRAGENVYVLLGQRGTAVDYPGLWNVPCGYLDWDETMLDGVFREVHEETGVDLLKILTDENTTLLYESLKTPYEIKSSLDANRQNVSMLHGVCIDLPELPKVSLDFMEPNEAEKVEWVNIEELSKMDLKYAFNHDQVISDFIARVVATANPPKTEA